MSAWAKAAADRIRQDEDRTRSAREWHLHKSREITARGDRAWLAIAIECRKGAEAFNSGLGSEQHPDAIQPFQGPTGATLVIRQINFPETRVECHLDLETRQIGIVWCRKESQTSLGDERSDVLDLDLSADTGDVVVTHAGVQLSSDQCAELILTPLLNRRSRSRLGLVAS